MFGSEERREQMRKREREENRNYGTERNVGKVN